MKKILIIILGLFLIVGCGSVNNDSTTKDEEKEEVVEKVKENNNDTTSNKEKHSNISGVYATYLEDYYEPYNYKDYYIFNEDGTFFKQNNNCSCIYHIEGTYEFIVEDDKDILVLKGKQTSYEVLLQEVKLEYKNDIIEFIEEDNDSEEYRIASSYYKQGCEYSKTTFKRVEKDDIEELEPVCIKGEY